MLGLKRGTVQLYEHEKEWELEAQKTIICLRQILGNIIKDIQHVGSTSIVSIKAKPIIDIALAVDDFNDILHFETKLREHGFYYRPNVSIENQLLFACGSFYDGTGDLQTHFIHVVRTNSMDWIHYINFRDYLNNTPSAAKEYEDLKVLLASQNPADSGRSYYLKGKHDFIVRTLRKALFQSYLGKTVHLQINRPIKSLHPIHKNLIYPINCGYIPNVFCDDGKEIQVYLLGVDTPLTEYTAHIIGIVHHSKDIPDILIAAPEKIHFTKEEIEKRIYFQEQFYTYHIELIPS